MGNSVRSCQHIHDEAYQHLFVFRVGFGNQQRQRSQANIVNHRLVVFKQTIVAMQKVDKQKRADALVAVTERMILDDGSSCTSMCSLHTVRPVHKIQQMRRLRFQRRIRRLAEGALAPLCVPVTTPLLTHVRFDRSVGDKAYSRASDGP